MSKMERKRPDTVPHYDLEALRANVEKRKANIALFQDAIQKEYEGIAQLKQLIREIEEGGER